MLPNYCNYLEFKVNENNEIKVSPHNRKWKKNWWPFIINYNVANFPQLENSVVDL